ERVVHRRPQVRIVGHPLIVGPAKVPGRRDSVPPRPGDQEGPHRREDRQAHDEEGAWSGEGPAGRRLAQPPPAAGPPRVASARRRADRRWAGRRGLDRARAHYFPSSATADLRAASSSASLLPWAPCSTLAIASPT